MPERLREILNRIREWWNRFTRRQKGIIIGLAVFTVAVFVFLIVLVNRPQYKTLIVCESPAQTAKVISTLEGENITGKTSHDALTVMVEDKDYSKAVMAIASAGVVPDGMTLEDVYGSADLSTTSRELESYYKLYMEEKIVRILEGLDGIESAKVTLHIPDQNGTLISQSQESSAYIQLETAGDFTEGNAANIARAVATCLGNETTAAITILGNGGKMLFTGGDDYSAAGIASSLQELQNTAESYIANRVKGVLLGTNLYNNIEVASHLSMDYAKYEETVKTYYPNEGRTEGMIASQRKYENETENGIEGVPGTDSNGEGTTYVTPDYSNSSSTTTETDTDYLPNERSLYSITNGGAIKYPDSSMSIAAISYKIIREEDVQAQGLLDGTTWEQYKLANDKRVRMEEDPEMVRLAATASGIPEENITLIAYEEPIFYDKEGLKVNWTTVLSAVLLLLILGLLAFVVIRSMSSDKTEESEQEIKLDDLLQSNPEPAIEDIDLENKSETRKMVEKFVDENPEAAAALLRNWLTEDW